jgi:hypothetical protein
LRNGEEEGDTRGDAQPLLQLWWCATHATILRTLRFECRLSQLLRLDDHLRLALELHVLDLRLSLPELRLNRLLRLSVLALKNLRLRLRLHVLNLRLGLDLHVLGLTLDLHVLLGLTLRLHVLNLGLGQLRIFGVHLFGREGWANKQRRRPQFGCDTVFGVQQRTAAKRRSKAKPSNANHTQIQMEM